MIVKNEAAGIVRTLESVRAHIHAWTVLDTGSTDGTQELVCRAMAGLPGSLAEEPFADFATSRNRALELAGIASGGKGWILMLSGDQIVENPGRLAALTRLADARSSEAISLDIRDGNLLYVQPVITRADGPCRYVGCTHEYLDAHGGSVVLARELATADAPAVVCVPSSGDRTARWELDLRLLAAERATAPTPRNLFYLAQTYECLGRNNVAEWLYATRILDDSGHKEEQFIAALRRARCLWRLDRDASTVMAAFERAHALCPSRAEPLHELAKYCLEHDMPAMAVGLATQAASRPLRAEHTLFVDADVYDVGAAALLQRAIAAAPQ